MTHDPGRYFWGCLCIRAHPFVWVSHFVNCHMIICDFLDGCRVMGREIPCHRVIHCRAWHSLLSFLSQRVAGAPPPPSPSHFLLPFPPPCMIWVLTQYTFSTLSVPRPPPILTIYLSSLLSSFHCAVDILLFILFLSYTCHQEFSIGISPPRLITILS